MAEEAVTSISVCPAACTQKGLEQGKGLRARGDHLAHFLRRRCRSSAHFNVVTACSAPAYLSWNAPCGLKLY